MAQDLFYYETGYIDESYFVYTADAESAQTSTSSMTVAVSVIKEAQADMSSEFTQTAVISHIEGADLFAMTDAALAAEVDRIRDNNIAASSAFTIATDASRTRHYSSDESADFTIVIDYLRVRFDEAALDAAFSLTADLTRQPGVVVTGSGTWSSEFTIDANGTKKQNIIDEDVSAEFTQTAIAQRLAGLSSQFEVVTFISNSQINRIRSFDSAVAAEFTQDSNVNEIVQLAADLSASASIDCTISHIEGADLTAFSNIDLSATASVIAGLDSALSASVSVSADAVRTRVIASSQSSTFTQTAVVDKLKGVAAELTATSTLTPIYLSYKNKHNHSAYFTGGGASLSTSNVKYGSGSLRVSNTTENSTLQIQTLKSQSIDANEDFYISIWIDMGSTTLGTANQFFGYVNAGNFEFGYRTNAGSTQNYASIRYNSSSYLTFANSNGTPGGWSHYELYRTGSTLTFRYLRQGGTEVTTSATYSGAIATGALDYIWFDAPSNASPYGYFDEFYMAKGISAPVNYKSSGEIFDGALSTTEFLFHFNGDLYDELAGPTEASASLTSTATLTAQSIITARPALALLANSQLSASADAAIRQASANLQVTGFVMAATGRIRPEVAALDSNFVLSATIDKIKNAQASLSSQFTLTSDGFDLDLASADLTSQFTLSASGDRYKLIQAQLESAGTFTTRATKTLATWSSDSWFRGLDTVTTFGAVNDGNFIYEINKQDSGDYFVLVKRELNRGTVEWSKKIVTTSTSANTITLDPVLRISNDVLYLAVGHEYNLGAGNYTWRNSILRINPDSGDLINKFDTEFFSFIQDMQIVNDSIYIAGDNGTTGASYHDPSVIKYDLSGTVQWKRTYDLANRTSEQQGKIYLINDNVYWTFVLLNVNDQSTTSYAVKLSATTGSQTWSRTGAYLQHVDASENMYLGSTTLAKVDSSGTTLWAQAFPANTAISLVTTDSDLNVFISLLQPTVSRRSFVQLDALGTVVWGKEFTGATQPRISGMYIYDDRLIAFGAFDTADSLILNVPAIDGGGDYYLTPFPTAYHSAGTWSYSDYTPTVTSASYTIPTTGTLSLTDPFNYNYGGLNPTISTAIESAFTYLYVVNGIGTWSASTAMNTVNGRIRYMSSQQSSAFTQTTQALKKVQLNAVLTASSTLALTPNRIRPGASALTAQAALSAQGKKFTGYISNQSSAFSADIQANRIRDVNSADFSAFSQVTNNSRSRDFDAQFTAFYTNLAAVAKNATGSILMESTSSFACDARKITDSPQYLFSQSNLSAQGTSTLFGDANLTAASAFNLLPTYLRRNEVSMTATASLSVPVIGRIRPGASSQAVQFFAFPSTDNSKITGYTAAWTSTSTQVVNNQILRLAQANLLSQFATPLVFAGILVRFEAELQVNGFQLTAGRVINIDLYYQLKIPSETRTLWIEPESRILSIDSETRVNKIKGYPQL